MSTTFRTDINGLRAWAVLLVVLFHFGVPGFNAGFLGVDVFFVISGYLMATILYRGLAAGNLSLSAFYASRMKRIYPALMLVCVSCLALGWFLVMPEDYRELGAHVRESVLFSSNYRYLSEAGYFDTAAESKWLLHTWSLSVEWQFYLLYPLVAMTLYRFSRHHGRLLVWTLALAGISLAWNTVSIHLNPDEAFFGFPGRAWELLLGGAVFHLSQLWVPSQRQGSSLHWGGLALIILAACIITPTSWPGLWALLPTLGAACLVLGNATSPLTRGLFWNWCGERSYSIYLWHWPAAVLLHYFLVEHEPAWIIVAITASLLLAELSYRLIEQPCRNGMAHLSAWKTILLLLFIALLIAGVAQRIRQDGVPERLPPHILKLVDRELLSNPRQDECLGPDDRCIYGPSPAGLILIGDSHADAVVTAVEEALASEIGGILFIGDSGCIPLPGLDHTDPRKDECLTLAENMPEILASHPGLPLLIISHWSSYANHGQIDPEEEAGFYVNGGTPYFEKTWFKQFEAWYISSLCQVAEQRPVWIMRPTPVMPADVSSVMGRGELINRDMNLSLPRSKYDERNAYIWDLQDKAALQCGIHILDPIETLCDTSRCIAEHSGLPIYRDDDHLTEYGNRLLKPMLKSMLEQWPR